MNYYYGVHGSVDSVFPKFIIKSIGIDFLIIRIDAYRLGLVFRPIVVWFFVASLIGLIGLKHQKNFLFYFIKNSAFKPNTQHVQDFKPNVHLTKYSHKSIHTSSKLSTLDFSKCWKMPTKEKKKEKNLST